MVSGLFPLLNVNIALVLNLRAILGNGTNTLTGDVELAVNDVLGLFYLANGLTIGINIGTVEAPSTVWSIHQIA